MKSSLRLLVPIIAVLVFWVSAASAAGATPTGWELRNGTWVPIVEPGAGTPEAQVAQMIRDLEAGRAAVVIDAAKDWIKKNVNNPLMPQVLLLQGDAEMSRGNKYRALYSYEDLLNNYPTSELFPATLEREYNAADAFLNGYKETFLGMRILPVTDDALTLLNYIQDRQRGSPIAERAGLRRADYFFAASRFPEAIDAYTDFLRRYRYSQYARKAEIRLVEASLADFRGVLFDFTPLYDARYNLARIADRYKQSAEQLQARAVDDRIYQLEGEKELEIARYYFRAGRRHASVYYYRRVIDNWPDTLFAETARRELVQRFPAEAAK